MAKVKKETPMTESAARMGREGGKARARNLSKERKSEIGKMGAEAYWKKYPKGDPKRRRKKKKASQNDRDSLRRGGSNSLEDVGGTD